MASWSDLFPDGRDIFYEGDDPVGFVNTIKAEFGFDPSADPNWGVSFPAEDGYDPDAPPWVPETGRTYSRDEIPPHGEFTSYQFRCPAEHLDAIYGSDRFPMGS